MDEKTKNPFELNRVRENFPILDQDINGSKLIYFDNAASTQKPSRVIKSIKQYYESDHSNVHRGVHSLSIRATESYEKSRRVNSSYINAKHEHEVIHTKGTTEAINLVAQSISDQIKENDEILISAMEHHSNIVPWQLLANRKKLKLNIIPIHESGEIDMDGFVKLLNDKTKLVAITHISNTLGIINPINEIIEKAHRFGSKVLIDGAQSIQHERIDLKKMDCDFFVFSGHKVFGPTGIGILYGKSEILNEMPPYQGGGDMIEKVSFDQTTFNELPFKFEAGTPNIVGGIALGTAIEFLAALDHESFSTHEKGLLNYAHDQLNKIENIRFYGQSKHKTSVISFNIGDIHPFDIGTLLDKQGIAVRTGHHCTQPIMDFYKIPGTIRVSFSIYNTKKEIDQFMVALKKAISILQA